MAAPLLPSSWVLADLFDVISMSLDVPDHVLEDEPGLELVPVLSVAVRVGSSPTGAPGAHPASCGAVLT